MTKSHQAQFHTIAAALGLLFATAATGCASDTEGGKGDEDAGNATAEIRVRRSWTSLSPEERKRYIDGVLALKQKTQLRWEYTSVCEGQPGEYAKNGYDYFVEVHLKAFSGVFHQGHFDQFNRPHMGPHFGPWHREFLIRRNELVDARRRAYRLHPGCERAASYETQFVHEAVDPAGPSAALASNFWRWWTGIVAGKTGAPTPQADIFQFWDASRPADAGEQLQATVGVGGAQGAQTRISASADASRGPATAPGELDGPRTGSCLGPALCPRSKPDDPFHEEPGRHGGLASDCRRGCGKNHPGCPPCAKASAQN